MTVQLLTLAELGHVSRGRSRHRPRDAAFLYGGPYPFIQTGDVRKANFFVTEFTQTYSDAGLAQSKMWPSGTLCITIAANIAEVALLGIDACFPDSIIGFIADENLCDARYVKYWFDVYKRQFKQVAQGAAQDNLSQEKLLSFKLPVPDLPVQIRIADILFAYDDLIENNRRRIMLLEEAAQELYKEWFVRLRFPGYESTKVTDGVPEGWERGVVNDLFQSLEDGDWIESKDQGGSDYRLLQISNIGVNSFVETNNFRFVTEQTFRSLRCQGVTSGDILISRMPKPIGRAWLVSEMPWKMITAVDVAIGKLNHKRVSTAFAIQYLNSSHHFDNCEVRASGTTRPRITRKNLAAIPLLLPSQRIQDDYAKTVNSILELVVKLRVQSQRLAEARDLVLPRLMSGKLEV